MPKMTGMDLAAETHALCPRLPILTLTGYGDEISKKTIEAAGIARLCCKPLTVAQLGEAVADTLAGKPPPS